jgi:nitroreductase
MELMDAIYHRRAARAFTDRPVERAVVDQLLEAAVQAPNALNLQPWAFILVQEPELIADLGRRAKEHFLEILTPESPAYRLRGFLEAPDFELFHQAPTLIVVCTKPGGLLAEEDCCFAAQNLLLAAHGLGLATCPVGFAGPWFRLPEVRRELGIPDDYTPELPIILGYPRESELPPAKRKPPEVFELRAPVRTPTEVPRQLVLST